ncbi:hypothetical protein RvY_05415 [Ramazzottius varieornatus]|uniref:Uncharacterized protein n=1 Tax=Ramazzottius varieornatus TaxID=947166 RepID=A0A1D1UY02_RAMVA|nr:hypothetical protein RvY_05415 [Ramazzottius varieornatus]
MRTRYKLMVYHVRLLYPPEPKKQFIFEIAPEILLSTTKELLSMSRMPNGTSKSGAKSPPLSILQIKWLLKTRIGMENDFKQLESKQEKNALWDKIRREMHEHFGQKFDNRSSDILRISYENSRKKYVKEKKKLMRQEKRVTSYRHYQLFDDAFGTAVAEEIIANGLVDGDLGADDPSTLPSFEEEVPSQNEQDSMQEDENGIAAAQEQAEGETEKSGSGVARTLIADRIILSRIPKNDNTWQSDLAESLRTFTAVLLQQMELMRKTTNLEEKRLDLEMQREARKAADAEAAREQTKLLTQLLQRMVEKQN